MYHIIGTDGKEYGPVTAEQLKQWIAEQRVNAQTKVKAEPDTDWQPLGTLPEFASVVASAGKPPPPRPAAETAKTSGMAVAALVFSLLGTITCGLSALIGLVLGIIALVKISNSQGRLSGKGLAIGSIVVAGVFVLFIPIMVAMLLPALAKAKQRAQTIHCVNNVKQLELALRIYSSDHNDTLPLAEHWCDAITNEVGSPKIYQCAADSNLRCAFAFNEKLSGKKEGEVNPQTVMIFESNAGWNASGGEDLLAPHQHSQRVVVIGLADGSVQQVRRTQLNTLRWDP
jgi:hypothetical protein